MDKRLSKKGLRIIAAESQKSAEEDIASIIKKNRIKYTVTANSTAPLKTPSIPYAFVFDTTGTLIFKGNPKDSQFDRTIKKALRSVDSGKK